MPLGFSSNGRVEKVQIIFAGYGISSSELKYDDYSVSNAKDPAAIVLQELLMAIIRTGSSLAPERFVSKPPPHALPVLARSCS